MVKQIYLAGGMSGMKFEDCNRWRVAVKDWVKQFHDSSIKVINPNDYYNFRSPTHKTEKEVRDFDLWLLRHSDLVIVNFNNPSSIGTAQELAIASELRIPVIGLNEQRFRLHPWLSESVERIFDDLAEMLEYVSTYYLD